MHTMTGYSDKRPCCFLAGGILLLFLLAASPAFALTEIFNVRHWAAPDHTRIVFDATAEPSYIVEREEGRVRIVIRDAGLSSTLSGTIPIEKPGIREIRLGVVEDKVTLDLALSENAGVNIFSLTKIQDKPHRLVVDILLPEAEKKEVKEPEQAAVPVKRRIVVLDPGHGGEAPGAVGRGGTQEKDVVLSIGKMARDILNKKPGYRVLLTRDGDYYISFRKRMKIARDANADLFVSIHADASRSRSVRGSSVYTLSLRGASSEAARLLAKDENLADVIGGSPLGESSDESDPIILNMFQTSSINRSKSYGQILLQHLNDVGNVKFRRVQEAPFLVLKLPEIPSVLVEVAFISNPNEEKLLRNRRHQRKVAEALASAIEEFLPPESAGPSVAQTGADNPPKSSVSEMPKPEAPKQAANAARIGEPAMEEQGSGKKRMREGVEKTADLEPKPSKSGGASSDTGGGSFDTYVVKKGDSLGKIAQRYGISVSRIARENRIDPKRPLYVNRKIKIPHSGERAVRPESSLRPVRLEGKEAKAKSPAYSYYKVRRGDSLASIAKKYDTTVKELRVLNGMKRSDALIVHRTIKIPARGAVRS